MSNMIISSDFCRSLLMQCIGTVMIEWEYWNFSAPSFDRGYLNNRLKYTIPVNTLMRQRLKRLFENVFYKKSYDILVQDIDLKTISSLRKVDLAKT